MVKPVKQESHGLQFPHSACGAASLGKGTRAESECSSNMGGPQWDAAMLLGPQSFHTLLIGLPLPKCVKLDGTNLVGKAPLLSPQNPNS